MTIWYVFAFLFGGLLGSLIGFWLGIIVTKVIIRQNLKKVFGWYETEKRN